MKEALQQILDEARKRLQEAECIQDAEDVRVKMLGKKGQLTGILKSMGSLTPEERKELGMQANKAKGEIEAMLNKTFEQLKEKAQEAKFKAEKIDVTEPGKAHKLGTKHPVTITIEEISKVFKSMGFTLTEGPEVETVYNNFDALNAGPNHPARDWTDTFYINDDVLLRTQTSPVQVRTLKAQKPPIRVFAPGRCFRCDTPDATHSPMFHQVEGLVVDEGITISRCSVRRPEPSSDLIISLSLNLQLKWTCPASSAEARDAEYARDPAGSRSLAAEWYIPPFSR